MDTQQKQNIFRLSATIYANNNYEISTIQLHKRVIEDALLQIDNSDGVSLDYLADYIEREYLFGFSDEELKKVLNNEKFKDVFYVKPVIGGFLYLLTPGRKAILKSRNTKVLGDYIREYLELSSLPLEKEVSIYRYLYDVFTTNVDGFRRMFDVKNAQELTVHHSPQPDDIDLINGFLNWDNHEKNNAIFNLASYALEFCMMTSKKGCSLKIDSLQSKTFYLDTNILYRALGINGEDRKSRALSLFRKLIDTKSSIKISNVTLEEFQSSLATYIKKLRKSETPAIQSKVYTEYVSYDDIWRFYHSWASKRQKPSIDIFAATLESQLESLLEDYNIEVDNLHPYSEEENKDLLNEMAAQIRGLSDNKQFNAAYNDAENILWVEKSRIAGQCSLFSIKTFLLSSDWGLYYWDSRYHSKDAPVVIMPSQWLSLLLRYGSRSNDDFKSFVCFLNIQSKDGILNSEQIDSILAGISETTTDLQQQRYLLEKIIENEFKQGAKGLTNEQLRKISHTEAERLLQIRVKELEDGTVKLEERVSSIGAQLEQERQNSADKIASVTAELNDMKQNLERSVDLIADKESEIQRLKNDSSQQNKQFESTKDDLTTERFENFKLHKCIKLCLLGFVLLVIVGLLIWFFCSSVSSDSIMGKLLMWIESLNPTQQYLARGILLFIFTGIFVPLLIKFIKISSSKFRTE